MVAADNIRQAGIRTRTGPSHKPTCRQIALVLHPGGRCDIFKVLIVGQRSCSAVEHTHYHLCRIAAMHIACYKCHGIDTGGIVVERPTRCRRLPRVCIAAVQQRTVPCKSKPVAGAAVDSCGIRHRHAWQIIKPGYCIRCRQCYLR